MTSEIQPCIEGSDTERHEIVSGKRKIEKPANRKAALPRRLLVKNVGVVDLQSAHVLGLQTFGALLDLEFNLRAFIQTAVPVGLDGREMHKHVVTAGTLDKSVALCGIKPFHNAFSFTYYSPEHCFATRTGGLHNKKATNGIRSLVLHSRCLYEQPFDIAPQFSQIARSRVKAQMEVFLNVGHDENVVLRCCS